MNRAVLAVMAGLLCTMAGFRHAASLKSDAFRIHRWVQLLRHITLLLRQGLLSIPEVLYTAADQAHPPDQLLRQMSAALNDTPLLALSDAFQKYAAPWPETAVLARLFAQLGRGSLDIRCFAAGQAADEMQLLAEAASAKAEKDSRLWQTLGFAGGACLTILLL